MLLPPLKEDDRNIFQKHLKTYVFLENQANDIFIEPLCENYCDFLTVSFIEFRILNSKAHFHTLVIFKFDN